MIELLQLNQYFETSLIKVCSLKYYYISPLIIKKHSIELFIYTQNIQLQKLNLKN